MNLILDLPPDLEARLANEASQMGLTLPSYIVRILSNGIQHEPVLGTGAELLAYWQRERLVGVRPEISDSSQHARALRKLAERRDRS